MNTVRKQEIVGGIEANTATPRWVTNLMYHEVRYWRDLGSDAIDPVYTISRNAFSKHLALVQAAGCIVTTVRDLASRVQSSRFDASDEPRGIVFSFDDGSACHADIVAPMLLDRGMTGEFFVNPADVGRKRNVSWAQLKDLTDCGFSVQSHGFVHKYMDELHAKAVVDQLSLSKNRLEQKLGHEVTVFAPPGGRINQFVRLQAFSLGYRAICTSRPGYWHVGTDTADIPRFAVRSVTDHAEIDRWVHGDVAAGITQAMRYRLLQAAKFALGNVAYDTLRGKWAGGR